MKEWRRFIGVSLVLGGISAGAAEGAQRFQFDKWIRAGLLEKQTAVNFHEWIESPNSTDKIIARIESEKLKSSSEKDFEKNVCSAFSKLGTESLSAYYQEIKDSSLYEIPCLKNRMDQLEVQWNLALKQEEERLQRKVSLHKVAYGSSDVYINTKGGPYHTGVHLPAKTVTLTFDDGPHPSLTPKLLDILDRYNIKATFFMLGNRAQPYPSTVREVARRGHTVGTHSHDHPNLAKFSTQSAIKNIQRGFNYVFDALYGSQNFMAPFFRFPYGARNSGAESYLKERNISSFGWNIDTLDWKISNPQSLYKFAVGEVVRTGHGTILMHDKNAQTIGSISLIINDLQKRGYRFVTLRPTNYITRRPF